MYSEARQPPNSAIILLCISFLLVLITAWGPTIEHIGDTAWAPHQEFHAFREIFLATFFSLGGLYICLGSLRKGESGALGKVVFLGIGVVSGFFMGLPITGIGKAGIEPFINHGLQVITLVSGALMCQYSSRTASH